MKLELFNVEHQQPEPLASCLYHIILYNCCSKTCIRIKRRRIKYLNKELLASRVSFLPYDNRDALMSAPMNIIMHVEQLELMNVQHLIITITKTTSLLIPCLIVFSLSSHSLFALLLG